MIGGYRIYDADAHVILAPAMWGDLPEKYFSRRPRPANLSDAGDMAAFDSGWLIEGRLEPHVFGPGSQPANTPRWIVEGHQRDNHTLVSPDGRLRDMDQMGIDVQFLFPSTLYARMTADPGFEAAMFRSYNRFMAKKCRAGAASAAIESRASAPSTCASTRTCARRRVARRSSARSGRARRSSSTSR